MKKTNNTDSKNQKAEQANFKIVCSALFYK